MDSLQDVEWLDIPLIEARPNSWQANDALHAALAQTLDPKFRLRELPATQVRGIEEPVAIYAALGFDE